MIAASDALGARAITRRSIFIRGIWRFLLITVLVVGLLILIWWWVASLHAVSTVILPSPGAVWNAAKATWPDALAQLRVTAQEAIGAIVVSWLVGIAAGVALGTMPVLSPLLGLTRSAYALPFVVLYPLMTIWFGLGSSSKVVFGALGGAIPMTLIVASGVRTIDPSVSLLFRSLDTSRLVAMWKGTLPALGPRILSGMRLSGSLALVYVVVAEMLASSQGIGYYIADAASSFETPTVYVGICLVIILAVLLHLLLTLIERVLMPSNSV